MRDVPGAAVVGAVVVETGTELVAEVVDVVDVVGSPLGGSISRLDEFTYDFNES